MSAEYTNSENETQSGVRSETEISEASVTEETGFQPDRSAGLRPAGPPASTLASSAGISAGRAAGFKPAKNVDPPQPPKKLHFPKPENLPATVRSRGYIPHIEIPGALYFITFRLADSIPKPYLRRLESQCNIALGRLSRYGPADDPHQIARAHKVLNRFSRTLERYLDEGHGVCYLTNPDVAEIIAGALNFFNGERYELHSWCVMPNHVHVLFVPNDGYTVSKVMHSWKSYTAQKANKVLERSGTFWSREYYDRIVRNEKQYEMCVRYVMDNPAKAGLDDWEWVWAAGMGEG